MKKIFLFIVIFYSIFASAENGWTVTFHPGNKRGLPDRYSYEYIDSISMIVFRTDIKSFKITLTQYQSISDISELNIKICNHDMQIVREFTIDYIIESNIIITNDWKIRDAFMKGNFVEIHIIFENHELKLSPDKIDPNKKIKYSVD